MKQFKLTFVLTVLMSMVGLEAFADWDTLVGIDGLYYYLDDTNNQAQVTFTPAFYGKKKYTGDIVITPNIENEGKTYSVTSIGESAFSGCTDLTSVTIPNSVTSIGESAFYGCSGLTSVTLNSNAIASKAYTQEDNIKNIFGEQVTEYIIGDGVTSIGSSTFSGCTGLTSISIPNSVTSIGSGAFKDCTGLTSVTLNSNAIASKAYTNSNNIKNIFGEQVKEYIIGDDVTSIGDYAFQKCSGLTSVTIGNSVTSIGQCAFQYCSGLTSVTIGNSVTSIGSSTFSGCTGLTSISIPNSVTSIGTSAFDGCSRLNKVIVKDIAAWCKISFGEWSAQPLYFAKHLYSDENTEITDLVIPDGVTSIGNYAFYCCSGLTSVTIPNSVTSIGNQAFEYCYGLTSVTIGNSVTSIGESAFSCSGLTSVTIPNSVTSIGYSAFCGCSGLTSVEIPNSVTTIGGLAFGDCTGLTSVTIGNSVTSIGNKAFYHCYRLTSVTIPNSVTSIGKNAFERCSGLTSVTIPNSVTSIGTSAFQNCSGLTSVTIGNSVTSIGEGVFYGCSGLTSVTIGNSVTSIVSGAFQDCTGLTSVTLNSNAIASKEYTSSNNIKNIFGEQVTEYIIGEGVTSIGGSAFYGCSGLTSVTIGKRVSSIRNDAFSGCSGLTSVTIGNSVTTIWLNAFENCSGLNKVIVKDIAAWCKISFYNNKANPLYYAKHLYSDENTEIKDLVIPDGVTSIGSSAFYGCSGLTSVEIPNSVTSIGQSAFYNCSGLTSVTIPNSVTSIGASAFDGTAWYNNQPDGLVYAGKVAYKYKGTMPENTSITIKEGTLGIGDSAFRDCSGLTSVTIPNSVTSFGNYAFNGCSGLKKVIVKDIAAWCGISFKYSYENPLYYAKHLYSDENTEITDLVIPDGVTSIGAGAFWNCDGLTSVEIPNSVTSILGSAFRDCSNLESVTIGNSVTSIGNYAFYGCSGLTSVVAFNPTPVTINQNTFTNRANATLYVPKGSKDAYKAADYWKEFKQIIEVAVTAISSVTNEQKVTETARYNLQGRRTNTSERGINIIRMSDGTIRKVLVK